MYRGGQGMWFILAFASSLFAALTSILAKIGIEGVNSNLATAIRTAVVLVLSWGMVFLTNSLNGISEISRRSWIFLILSGLTYRENARLSYADISAKTGISVNTIKTFCRRNCLTDAELAEQSICMNCGCAITKRKYRPKKFCSDKCRMAWWNTHQDQVNRNAHYSFTCPCDSSL